MNANLKAELKQKRRELERLNREVKAEKNYLRRQSKESERNAVRTRVRYLEQFDDGR